MIKKKFSDIDGLLLLDKPAGLSSNRALQKARYYFNASKAGHAGTLDPFATGLLLCCFGKYTQFSSSLMNSSKVYVATIKFGEETDSGDLTGNIIYKYDNHFILDNNKLLEILSKFIGEIEQIPPMYSALKYRGVPLYKYARKGININREPRKTNIENIKLLSIEENYAKIEVSCGKGTYIRTLAQDIGRAIGFFAHLVQLRRTSIGQFALDQAVTLDLLSSMESPEDALLDNNELPINFFK